MSLINTLKIDLKGAFYMARVLFYEMDIRDLPYQFNVMFPKVPKHSEEEEKMRIKKLVLRYLHLDGEICSNYITSEDVRKRKLKVAQYNFKKC